MPVVSHWAFASTLQLGRSLRDNEDGTKALVSIAICSGVGLASRDLVVVVRQTDPFLPCAWVESYREDRGEISTGHADTPAGVDAEEFKDSTAVVVALYPQPNADMATKDGVAFTFVVDRSVDRIFLYRLLTLLCPVV